MEKENLSDAEPKAHRNRIFNQGEMAHLIKNYDWDASTLGPIDGWSETLVSSLNLILDCSFPMLIWWGAEKTQFYNDACIKLLFAGKKSKHPLALGQAASSCWAEIWPIIEENLTLLESSDTSFFEEDKLIPFYRNGQLEEMYWTYSYSKLRNEHDDRAGILIVVKETTKANRLLQREESAQLFFLQLADRLRGMHDMDEMIKSVLAALGTFLNVERVGFAKICQTSDELDIKHNFLQRGVRQLEGIYKADVLGVNYLERLGQGALFSDLIATKLHNDIGEDLNVRSANMPLLHQDSLKAVVFLHRTGAVEWSDWELSIVKQSSERLWDAMVRVKAVDKLSLSEQRYRAIFESIDEAFMVIEFIFDALGNPVDYKFLTVNPAFEVQSGLTNIVGKHILEIMPNVEPVWIKTYGAVAKTGVSNRFEQYNEGTARWYSVYAASIGLGTKQVVVVFSDITARKLEEQRKNDFLSMASHELKTPLTSINGYMQLLRKKMQNEETGLYIDMLERTAKQIDRMTSIINGFLSVSQWDGKGISLTKETFDIGLLLREIYEETGAHVSSHRIRLEPVDVVMVHADRYKIVQVMQNFISNAMKYGPKQSEVVLRCRQEKGWVEVSVADEGIGISPEYQQHVFDRFYRIENQSTQGVSGFGIGLYLCAEIIRSHAGEIGVDSQPNKGARFWFTLKGLSAPG